MSQHQKVGLTNGEKKSLKAASQIKEKKHNKGKQPKSFFKEWKNYHVQMAEIPLFFLFAYYSDYVVYSCPYCAELTMSTPVSIRH